VPTPVELTTADDPTLLAIRKALAVGKVVTFVFDGGGEALEAGAGASVVLPYGFTAQAWTLIADQAGDVVLDVWVDTLANHPPTNADSVASGHEPAIVNGTSATGNMTGWASAVWANGSVVTVNVDSCTGIQKLTLTISGVES
jgi:hypothetical protein